MASLGKASFVPLPVTDPPKRATALLTSNRTLVSGIVHQELFGVHLLSLAMLPVQFIHV